MPPSYPRTPPRRPSTSTPRWSGRAAACWIAGLRLCIAEQARRLQPRRSAAVAGGSAFAVPVRPQQHCRRASRPRRRRWRTASWSMTWLSRGSMGVRWSVRCHGRALSTDAGTRPAAGSAAAGAAARVRRSGAAGAAQRCGGAAVPRRPQRRAVGRGRSQARQGDAAREQLGQPCGVGQRRGQRRGE